MSQEQLNALAPEVLADRQRLVNAAVRYARNNGLCTEFERALRVLMPEMGTADQYGEMAWFDTDGVSCRGTAPQGALPQYNSNGWDGDGFDRDGYSRYGCNRDGLTRYQVEHANDEPAYRFDARGYDENGRDARGYDRDGLDPDGYNSNGYYRNGGDRRQGRPATAEELVAVPDAPFNPTTYVKPTE